MRGPSWRDRGGCSVNRFSNMIPGNITHHYTIEAYYSPLHKKHALAPVLNAQWTSSDPEDRWIRRLHSMCSIHLSCKLRAFAWLVINQRLPSKAWLAKEFVANWRQWNTYFGTANLLETVGITYRISILLSFRERCNRELQSLATPDM